MNIRGPHSGSSGVVEFPRFLVLFQLKTIEKLGCSSTSTNAYGSILVVENGNALTIHSWFQEEYSGAGRINHDS